MPNSKEVTTNCALKGYPPNILSAKELERIVIRQLRIYTLPQSDPLEFGNKQGISTTDMLVKLLHIWHTEVENGNPVRIVFLDYLKAFDNVNHHIFLEKQKSYGILLFSTAGSHPS